jgi:hypothetical protein
VAIDGPLVGFINILNQLPAESLKRFEEMDDDTLNRTVHSLLADPREAAADLKRKLQELHERILARNEKERAEPQKSLPAPAREAGYPLKAKHSRAGHPAHEQEPPETVEAVTEEPKKKRSAPARKTAKEPEEETPPPRQETMFYTQGGARVIPISEFGHVRKS